ncbi:sugar ABC transporter substrate-binding protein, partial [Vibrio parahaemolyticus]|nr:sugar ABC transporter substrate-binding protein [Vibrio parahaemolyticus]
MTKFLVISMSMILLIASLAGCSSGGNTGGNSSGGTTIGVVLPTKDEPRWVQDETRFKEALADTDYSVEILFSQGSSAKEKENVESLLTKGIK